MSRRGTRGEGAGVSEWGPAAGEPSKANYLLEEPARAQARDRVRALLGQYPVYPELDLDFLLKHFG